MTITEFLLARIAEDEADAIDRVALPTEARRSLTVYDAERVHAECAAKRAIVERYEKFYVTRRANWMNANYVGAMEELGWVLGALAAIYADHPDYQPEWVLS